MIENAPPSRINRIAALIDQFRLLDVARAQMRLACMEVFLPQFADVHRKQLQQRATFNVFQLLNVGRDRRQ